jgi:hypothetical protein
MQNDQKSAQNDTKLDQNESNLSTPALFAPPTKPIPGQVMEHYSHGGRAEPSFRRPRKFTPKVRKRYLGFIRDGLRKNQAAQAVNISPGTVREYVYKYPAFAQALEQAEVDACEKIEDVLMQKALSGHFPSICKWLENRSCHRWNIDKLYQQEVTGQNKDDFILIEIIKRLDNMLSGNKTILSSTLIQEVVNPEVTCQITREFLDPTTGSPIA